MNQERTTREQVIDVLREGRATPGYIVDETDCETKQNASYHLRQLRAEDRVRKVTRGLYELADDHNPRETYTPEVVELPDGATKISDERWALIQELVDNGGGTQ